MSVHIADVIDVVCEHYGCSKIDLRAQRRTARIVEPRQIAMYLACRLTERSLPQIGQALGDRDHTTVLYARDKVDAKMQCDPTLAETLAELEIAVVSLGQLRGRGLLPKPEKLLTPKELALRIVAGGKRAAVSVSADHVLALADALIAAEEFREAHTLPVMVDAPPPALASPVGDFLRADAAYNRAASINLRAMRDDRVERLRERREEDERVAALIVAYDALLRAEFTLAERDATQRYRAAVTALSVAFPQSITRESPAHA
jgi:hypothetical protein